MTPKPTPTPLEPASPVPLLDAERLQVYHLSLELQAMTCDLVPRGHADLRDQLARASASVSLNLAEGAGRRAPREKAQFYSIARGSAMESAAVVDILRVRRLAPVTRCQAARALLVRIVQMVTRLEQRMADR